VTCKHERFAANVHVGRLTNAAGEVTQFVAEIKIKCADCNRQMQFVGLPAGFDTQGACVSVDGLEARLALCPQGEALSLLDHISAKFGSPSGTVQ
jgi:hypothetical protein